METLIENILVYGAALLFCALVVYIYLRKQRRESKITEQKIAKARLEGSYEPVSLHPVVDHGKCIRTGACIAACPEKDILGIVNGKATTINASRCVGHGACFHACPTEAITLCIGTERRGVELPHISQDFQTNVPGIFIAGELGGMGLIKNAVEQGRQAMEHLAKSMTAKGKAPYDAVIVGAGPAGISATLTAKKLGLQFITLEQDTVGGTVFTFPRSKIVMTSAMDLPLHGKVKLFETSKTELLKLWTSVFEKNGIRIRENSKVETINREEDHFLVTTSLGEEFRTSRVLLAIGRRGTPRKLGVDGEELEKVAYRLLEPEHISGKNILVVGGGDSAVESAMLLADQNRVTLVYRGETFSRIKPGNAERIQQAITSGKIEMMFNTNPVRILPQTVELSVAGNPEPKTLNNDLVYIFAGGELPTQFLQKTGIQITKKFGDVVLSHK